MDATTVVGSFITYAKASDSTVIVTASSDPQATGEALLEGEVTISDQGCVGVTAGGQAYLVVWPKGTRYSTSDGRVNMGIRGTVVMGESVSLGGSFSEGSDWSDQIPRQCQQLPIFLSTAKDL